jgi:hypothetical protein
LYLKGEVFCIHLSDCEDNVSTDAALLQEQEVVAHRKTTQASTSDVVKYLVEVLGRQVTSVIASGANVTSIDRWAEGGQPREAAIEQQLRTAYLVFQFLLQRESAHVLRAWFIGINPQLNDVSPVEALGEGRTRDVVIAARSFVQGG